LESVRSRPIALSIRTFAEDAAGDKSKKAPGAAAGGDDDDMTKELVLTPGEKVVAATRLTMWAGIAALAAVCAYYIGSELFPTYVQDSCAAVSGVFNVPLCLSLLCRMFLTRRLFLFPACLFLSSIAR
jgi:hypothetical protein